MCICICRSHLHDTVVCLLWVYTFLQLFHVEMNGRGECKERETAKKLQTECRKEGTKKLHHSAEDDSRRGVAPRPVHAKDQSRQRAMFWQTIGETVRYHYRANIRRIFQIKKFGQTNAVIVCCYFMLAVQPISTLLALYPAQPSPIATIATPQPANQRVSSVIILTGEHTALASTWPPKRSQR